MVVPLMGQSTAVGKLLLLIVSLEFAQLWFYIVRVKFYLCDLESGKNPKYKSSDFLLKNYTFVLLITKKYI